tara:strand:- start:7548 stop:9374 length:1827 start_codon:yes stop_codon:yes gene_type:complete
MIIDTKEDLDLIKEKILAADKIAFDTETNGLMFDRKMIGCSLAIEHKGKLEGFYFPTRHEAGFDLFAIPPKNCPSDVVLELLKSLFFDASKTIYIHNAKFDIKTLRNEGIDPQDIKATVIDTLCVSWLIDPGKNGGHGLKTLVREYFGYDMTTFDQVTKGFGGNEYVPVSTMGKYAIDDAVYLYKLQTELLPQLNESQLKVLNELEMPVMYILEEMEHYGFKFDVAQVKEASIVMRERLKSITDKFCAILGDDAQIGSSQWLSKKLCDNYWGTKGVPRGKSGFYSTANEHLEKWAEGAIPGTSIIGRSLAKLVLEYRQLSKMLSTYCEKLPIYTDSQDRIHGSFNQFGTDTGRMSSSKPNLQNIPSSRTKEGDLLRRSFIAEDGYELIVADYSQVELRVMAHLSKDPVMCTVYQENGDIHQMTADACGCSRFHAKGINFGLIYKMGAKTLSKMLGVSVSEAQSYSDKYFANYAGVVSFHQKLIKKVRDKGYVWTITGRIRKLTQINLGDSFNRSKAERQAINTQVQGSAADIIKIGMRNFIRRVREEGYTRDDVRIVCQVHDEVVVEAKEEISEQVSDILKFEMENCVKLIVPLIAEPAIGKSWGEAK